MAAWRAAIVYFLGTSAFVEQQVLSVRLGADSFDGTDLVEQNSEAMMTVGIDVQCAIAANMLAYPDSEVDLPTKAASFGDPTLLNNNGIHRPDEEGETGLAPMEVGSHQEAAAAGYQWYKMGSSEVVVGQTPIPGLIHGSTATDLLKHALGQEALFLVNERAHARKKLEQAGWTREGQYVKPTVDDDPQNFDGTEVTGVRFDLWLQQEHAKPARMMITFRGSQSTNDMIDIWKWVGNRLVSGTFAESYATLFQQYVDSDVVPAATSCLMTTLGHMAAAYHQGRQKYEHNRTLLGGNGDAALPQRVQANGYFELLPPLAEWVLRKMEHYSVSTANCISTGHSAGGARAHVFAELLNHKTEAGQHPSVITFAVPGYHDRYQEVLQHYGVAPSLVAQEFSHPVDFWSAAIQPVGPSDSNRALHLLALPDLHKEKLKNICGPLVGTSGTGLLVMNARAYKSCRHLTHATFPLYKYLVMAPLTWMRQGDVDAVEASVSQLFARADEELQQHQMEADGGHVRESLAAPPPKADGSHVLESRAAATPKVEGHAASASPKHTKEPSSPHSPGTGKKK